MGKVRIGIAGWSYKDWEGIVYPSGAGKKFDQLAYLAGYFDLIEVNVTFYRIPQARNCVSWLKRTEHNPDFRFTVKLNRHFTHERDELTSLDQNQWREGILHSRRRISWAQCWPSSHTLFTILFLIRST